MCSCSWDFTWRSRSSTSVCARPLLFTVLTYAVALACEWSSVHNGFPFGLYHYIPATRGREIWVLGVPFMDSISFTFLSFASYTLALLLSAPLYRRGLDLRTLDTWEIRRSPRVWLMAALFMVMIDMVADPLSVLGDRWFLAEFSGMTRRGRISAFQSATISDGISSRR